MWQKLSEDSAQLKEARVHDYLFCSVLEDGIQSDKSLSNLYVIIGTLSNSFVLMSLANGSHTIKGMHDFRDRYWWYLRTPRFIR